MTSINRYFKTICIMLALSFPLSACGMSENETSSPLVGKTVEIQSALFVLTDLNKHPALTESATALRLGNFAAGMDELTSCAGCNYKTLNLKKFLPVGSNLKITKSYTTVPPMLHIGGSGVEYFVMDTNDGVQFAIPAYTLDNTTRTDEAGNRDADALEKLFDSFANDTETKSFYIQTKQFYQESMFPGKRTAFSSDDIKGTFKNVFADIGKYHITDINTQTGQLAFSVTTDREGLAYLILKTSEQYVTISPFTNLTPSTAPQSAP